MKTDVIVSHEALAETVSDVPQHAILIPLDKPSDDHAGDHPEKTIVIPSDELSSDKPSEEHDGDHPENTIVIPSDEPSEDDEESENGLLCNEQIMNSDGYPSLKRDDDEDSQQTMDLDMDDSKDKSTSANNFLGSNDLLLSIETNCALGAAANLGLHNSEEDNEEASIDEKSSKPSESLNESSGKSSKIDSSTLDSSSKLASTERSSEDLSTDPNDMTIKLPESTVDASQKLTDDSRKAEPITIIPPAGVVMVNFQPNPIKVTVDVTENDGVGAKLKLASEIARNYTKAGNVAEDFMTAEKISMDLTHDGETV